MGTVRSQKVKNADTESALASPLRHNETLKEASARFVRRKPKDKNSTPESVDGITYRTRFSV
ncbi:hypothetical protein, partial [Kosakonia quasisacchari]